ncbi:hypothetical protein C8Q79DRAFT_1003251 [Trametes meyenii]|nr:hypothetical protein C8Q79DRAFT_1003251 [Trametes meyenii]
MANTGAQRQPNPIYKDHDGFTERVVLKMSGAAPSAKCNLHAVAANSQTATREDLRELRDAVQRRQFVEDLMELRGTFFPGLDAIKRDNEIHESSATIKERMQEMEKRHIDEVRTIYQWQAQDYHDEMLELSQSKPDIDDPDVESFYQVARSSFDLATTFDDHLDRLNHAYLSSLQPLVRDGKMYQEREEAEQRRRDQQFPTSRAEFHAIRSKDVQLRIAKFLAADSTTRERTMDAYKWAWRQVSPLVREYGTSEYFEDEVRAILRENEVQDPRKSRRD